jgi:hypothetical protein
MSFILLSRLLGINLSNNKMRNGVNLYILESNFYFGNTIDNKNSMSCCPPSIFKPARAVALLDGICFPKQPKEWV